MKYKPGTFSITPNKEFMRGKPTELQAIHFWLCERSDPEGLCFPSRPKIAEDAGIKSLRTVDKYINMLVEMGILVKTKRRKEGEAKNRSNLYQIMVHEMHYDENNVQEMPDQRASNDTYQRAPNGTVTIPIINNTHLTIHTANAVVPNQEEIKDSSLVEKDNDDTPLVSLSVPTKLPDRLGKNSSLRFIEAYRKLYKRKFGVEYSVTNFAKTIGQASQFLKNKTELQALMMLDYYFIWHGGSAKDVRENEFLHNKFFPLSLFYSKENELKTFIINHEHIDYDDPEKVYKFAVDNFPTLFPKEN